MDVTIRRARPSEHDTIGRLTLEAYSADRFVHADDDYAETLLDAARRDAIAELWVAVDGEDLLGTVTFVLPGTPLAEASADREGEFRMLAVSAAARGRGVGDALVRLCQRRAVEEGLSGLVLSTLPGMRSAHRLYERLGFVRAPERTGTRRPTCTCSASPGAPKPARAPADLG
jgi:ribosomal protein S18 acetylase RimI-like enzyme